jgi:hypothetical protein
LCRFVEQAQIAVNKGINGAVMRYSSDYLPWTF